MPDNPPTDEGLNPSDEDLRWLSTRDAAAHLGITPRTVYKLIDTNQLRAYRFGRVIRIRGRDLDTYIDNARIQPGSLRHLYPETPDGDDGLDEEAPPNNDGPTGGDGNDDEHR